MVAQQHLSTGVFERLFSLAAQCAKALGLHHWHAYRDQLGDEEAEERRNVSWCLYVLDKAVCWTSGTSPSITTSDVLIDPAPLSPQGWTLERRHLAAKAGLAAIEEAVYLEVYAVRPRERSPEEARQSALKLWRRLQEWRAGTGIDLDAVQQKDNSSGGATENLPFSQAELELGFVCAQLLLVWPYRLHADHMFPQPAELARNCLRSMLRLWSSAADQDRHAAMPRSVRCRI